MMPTKKVKATGVGGAFSLVLVWAASLAGVDVPALVAGAITLLLGTALGYIVPEKAES